MSDIFLKYIYLYTILYYLCDTLCIEKALEIEAKSFQLLNKPEQRLEAVGHTID